MAKELIASIDEAIKKIEKYKKELELKERILLKRLADIGIGNIKITMMSVPEIARGDWSVDFPEIKDGTAVIRLTGDQVMFLEFSSGITYGTQHYPLPSGDPYGAGTYPAKPDKFGRYNWSKPGGWYYKKNPTDEKAIHTYGVRAYMPMYHAEESIIFHVANVVREVFGE